MATKSTPLTASSTIGNWLADPVGGPLIRELLERGGFVESTLAPVRDLPPHQLVALSRGLGPFLNLIPPVATAEHVAASITVLLSNDAVNINGAILPSDGGWSVQ